MLNSANALKYLHMAIDSAGLVTSYSYQNVTSYLVSYFLTIVTSYYY